MSQECVRYRYRYLISAVSQDSRERERVREKKLEFSADVGGRKPLLPYLSQTLYLVGLRPLPANFRG